MLKLLGERVRFGCLNSELRIDLFEKPVYLLCSEPRPIHVKAHELHRAPAGGVEVTHPVDQVEYLVRLPYPVVNPFEECLRVTLSSEDVAVDEVCFRKVRFDGEDGEAVLLRQVPYDPVFEREELMVAVRCFSLPDDPGVPDESVEEREVLVRSGR